MPKYHFVSQDFKEKLQDDLPPTRVSTEYAGNFDAAEYFLDSKRTMIVKDCERSLLLALPKPKVRMVNSEIGLVPEIVDMGAKIEDLVESEGLNKLHIGRLALRHPHAEIYERPKETGLRVDLHEFDLAFAVRRLEEIKNWRDVNFRHVELDRYDHPPISKWYSTFHRLRQIAASPARLEEEIGKAEAKVRELERTLDNTFISDNVLELEKQGDKLIRVMGQKIADLQTLPRPKAERSKPRIVLAPDILVMADDIYLRLRDVLDFVNSRMDEEKAMAYWLNVDSWAEELCGFPFFKYHPAAVLHVKRHFPGSGTPGSMFVSPLDTPWKVLDTAFEQLKARGYNGARTELQVNMPQTVGLEGVVATSDLPRGTVVRRTERDKHEVDVVFGIPKQPTSNLAIIAGPPKLEGEKEHRFYSIYPGRLCPELEDKGFWEKHAFIAD